MWRLGRLLLMVGRYIPDEDPHWMCFMDLLRILVLSTVVEVTEDTISDLTVVIEGYISQYNKLYPDSMTHYLLHLSEKIKR